MKINWKVRFKHKPFLVALFALILLLVQQVSSAFGYPLSDAVGDEATAIFNTVLSILVLVGVVTDPTTVGTSDSQQAMFYKKPRDEVK